jgi:mevalonate kinase
MDINHHLLCAMGVSHPSLDVVFSRSLEAGFHCKLTGAGGGGCAITLIGVGHKPAQDRIETLTSTLW